MKSRLFEPIKIGTMQLRNRLVMPAMGTQYADQSGFVTQRQIDYYVERARNNIGLIITEVTCVSLGGRVIANQLGIYDDAFIPGLRRLAEAVKEAGAKCVLQLHHGGRRAFARVNNGIQPVAPSAIPVRLGEIPRELTIEEIKDIIYAFSQGALRAKEAGFDGVEMHCAHGYLIAQFLSPLTNKRTDKYGGDFKSRARLSVEILQSIRQKVGENYPLIARIGGEEYIKGGFGLIDAQRLVKMLGEAGLNAVNVSASYTASSEEGYLSALFPWSSPPMSMSHGCYLNLAEGIKKITQVPVIAVGRLDAPDLVEEVIIKERADLVAVGRGLLADSAFGSKVYEKRYSDIRRCIACNECVTRLFSEGVLKCTVNAELGKEEEYRLKPVLKKKKVLVVGGGPGGMEAARVAALRGHEVILLEREPNLGGNLIAAAAPSFKRDISRLTEFLENSILKGGVKVSLNTEADREKVFALKPDVVILATGASPIVPPLISGVDPNTITDAVEVLKGKAKVGPRVIVAGGGAVGCEVAAFLAENGKEVTIVEMRNTDFSETDGLAVDMNPILRRWFLFELWPKLGIEVIGKSTFLEVTEEGLVVQDKQGRRSSVKGDNIVFAAGMRPNNSLRVELEGSVPTVYEVGDCSKPGKIIDAIETAARIARNI